MREAAIESAVCKYAKSKGWLTYKFVSPSTRGVPDRIFMKEGVMFFVEFKALGKKPTRLQYKVAEMIQQQGFTTYVIDGVEKGKKLINSI